MKRISLLTIAMFCLASIVSAQTLTVMANHLGGYAPITGTVTWAPVTSTGTPMSYQAPTGGQQSTTPLSINVVSGVFSTTLLPDVTATNPPGVCFRVMAFDSTKTSVLGPGYSCVQPHITPESSSDWCQHATNGIDTICNLDNYTPNMPSIPLQYAPYSAPDFLSTWNAMVTAYIASGNTLTPTTLTDASTVTYNGNNQSLSVATLPLSNTIGTRTINVSGLTAGSRFAINVQTNHSMTGVNTSQTVNFGSGCTWIFAPGPNIVNDGQLVIPPYATGSYFVYGVYDGTNCLVTIIS
ncbi:MAG: hypothetical protein WAN50_00415 [Minisyncoccia bacterium]